MFWLSSLPQFRQFRDFSVTTNNFSIEDEALEVDDGIDEDMQRRKRPVRYLPSYASSYRIWYKGRYITISRTKEDNRWYSDKSTLLITSVFNRYPLRNPSEVFPPKEYFPVTVLSLTL